MTDTREQLDAIATKACGWSIEEQMREEEELGMFPGVTLVSTDAYVEDHNFVCWRADFSPRTNNGHMMLVLDALHKLGRWTDKEGKHKGTGCQIHVFTDGDDFTMKFHVFISPYKNNPIIVTSDDELLSQALRDCVTDAAIALKEEVENG